MPASVALVAAAVPPMQLHAVTLLELMVEVLEELIECRHRLVGQIREGERIGFVGHVSEPRRRGGERSRSAC